MSHTPVNIAVLSSCGSELLLRPLQEALARRGIAANTWCAPYAQYHQVILDGESRLFSFDPAFIILHLDAADLFADVLQAPLEHPVSTREQVVTESLGDLRGLLRLLATRLPSACVLVNTVFLSSRSSLRGLEYNTSWGVLDLSQRYNLGLGGIAEAFPAARIVDVAGLAAEIGFSRWSDPRVWYLARSRCSLEAYHALASRYAVTIACELGRMRKCLVLDLDNVLWGGLAAEEGPLGVRLGNEGISFAFVEFQRALLALQRQGVVLAIASKNNPDDAWAVIRTNPTMVLREEHFAATRINWTDKATNIRELAVELNLGLDALAFIDDSPAERDWVRRSLPEVATPEWPADPADYVDALQRLAADEFEKTRLTNEDQQRGAQYRAQAERSALAATATDLETFYRSLDMHAIVSAATAATIPRIAQLTQKTNQFNLTTRRYSEADIAALSKDQRVRVYTLDLRDRFGDNGIVGVLIFRWTDTRTWDIDSFLLSCRVMGRTVERAFLGAALERLRLDHPGSVVGTYLPTQKNQPVSALYPDLGFCATASPQQWTLDLRTQGVAAPPWIRVEWGEGAEHVE